MTPSESASPNTVPETFDASIVVFNKREQPFDSAMPIVTGSDLYTRGERLAVATSLTATTPVPSGLSDLPSSSGSSLNVKLWSSSLTDPRLREGDWVMLSRKYELGSSSIPYALAPAIPGPVAVRPGSSPSNLRYNVIHRHRWYRITGIDNSETWPRSVRLDGPAWDYPETFGVGNGVTSVPAISTHATIFSNVTTVYRNVISVN